MFCGFRPFLRLFVRQVVRDMARHRMVAACAVGSVALGVAVWYAVTLAGRAAAGSFAASVDAVAGRAHLEVRGAVPEEWLPRLAAHPDVAAATPVVEGFAALPGRRGEYLRVVGVDFFTNAPFRSFEVGESSGAFDLDAWLGEPGNVAVTAEFLARSGVALGGTIRALAGGRERELRPRFALAMREMVQPEEQLAVMDLAWAQEWVGRPGRLSAIQLLVRDPARIESAAASIRALLPADLAVAPPATRSAQLGKMIGAFRLNLAALSMVALLVGVFLIYNAMAAAVVRRRRQIGILRALGVSRGEVAALFVGEGALYGAVGGALGVVGGWALAQGLVRPVAATVSTLYANVAVAGAAFDPGWAVAGWLAGVGAAIFAASWPAREAARIEPVESLGAAVNAGLSRRGLFRWCLGALACAGGATALAAWALAGWPLAGFAGAALVLGAFACLAPPLLEGASRLAERCFARGTFPVARLAAQNLRRSLGRNATTLAALAAAIAMATALATMIYSFRRSVEAWAATAVVADLYLAPAENEVVGTQSFVPPPILAWWRARPEVEAVETYREMEVRAGGEPTWMAVIDGLDRRNLVFEGGDGPAKMRRVIERGEAIISESLARHRGWGEGDLVEIAVPGGVWRVRVAGVYRDYTRDRGVLMVARGAFERHWSDPGVHSFAVYLREGSEPERSVAAYRAAGIAGEAMAIYGNAALRGRILGIFDQTFAVTYVLRTVAVVVAVAGILLSFTALVLERKRAVGALLAIGASPGQVAAMFLGEAAMVGALASGLGLAAGMVLAGMLTGVINPAFFGWSIRLEWPWAWMVVTPLWIVPVSLVAAALPARAAARIPVAEAVRFE